MRKLWLLAFVAAMLAAMPALTADKPIYSMWSPTYNGMTKEDLKVSAIEFQKAQTEARERNLTYSLIGLAGLFGAVMLFGFLNARRRRMASAADAAIVGSLAAVVSAKRNLGRKIEERIAAKSNDAS
jgi:hypothetical protein